MKTTLVCIHCGSEYTFGDAKSHTWSECATVLKNEIRQLEENLRVFQIAIEAAGKELNAAEDRLYFKNRRLSGQRRQVRSLRYAIKNTAKDYKRIADLYLLQKEVLNQVNEENKKLHSERGKL